MQRVRSAEVEVAGEIVGKIWHDTKYGPLPKEEYKRAYRDMLMAVDKSVGEMVATLERLGLRENTLIFITSDNGAYSWVGSNAPYRGQKGDLFEGGHRVPAIVNWPGHVPAGSVSDATAITMDLLPTFLQITGVAKPDNVEFDGIDISSVWLERKGLPERTLLWRFNNVYTKKAAYAVREGKWKYIEKEKKPFLFNLKEDPGEEANLADGHPEMVDSFRRKFKSWEQKVTEN